jgi:hypothetical protein
MQTIHTTGYTGQLTVTAHPDGSTYWAIRRDRDNQGTGPQGKTLEIRQRRPDGSWRDVRTYVGGRDFNGAIGACSLACLPDGSLIIGISAGIPEQNAVAQLDVIPAGCAPYNIAAMQYTYQVSANDAVARQQAQAALETAQRAERAAKDAMSQVKEDGANVERKALAEIAAAKAGLQAAIANAPGSGITEQRVKDIAWPLIADRIYAELNNPQAPLTNTIAQQAKTAATALLKSLGLIK